VALDPAPKECHLAEPQQVNSRTQAPQIRWSHESWRGATRRIVNPGPQRRPSKRTAGTIMTNQRNSCSAQCSLLSLAKLCVSACLSPSSLNMTPNGGVWSPSTPDVDVSSECSATYYGIGPHTPLAVALGSNVSLIFLALAWLANPASILAFLKLFAGSYW
jgi:hypothetical protein